ncbi:MFS transporter [Acetobacterium bakii]|uniref:MFS transporter n=1 Tax=Acetobacterium bakii TaxID=52689 RepID=A0A0L6TYI4_9FIRM|nr:MFS transporter [Acetobacterium bakii]KNZ40630.1 MFS transporter [Acetobacterium bakii]
MNNQVVRGSELSKLRILLIILLVSFGSSVLFQIIYLRFVFYQPIIEALNITNTQLGALGGIYGLVATICYLPGGIIADKMHAKYLASAGFISTALVTFWFALLPSYNSLLIIFGLFGATSVLIFWGIRYKLVRLVSTEKSYPKNIGLSYGIYGLSGLILNFIALKVFEVSGTSAATGLVTILIISGVLNLLFGVATWFIVPIFDDEIKKEASFNINEFIEAIKHPGVWLTTASMFFIYGAYAALTYTTPYLTEIFGASLALVSIISMIRTYGISLFSAPIIGGIATKINSPAKVLVSIMALTAISGIILAFLPTTQAMLVVAIIVVLVAGFFTSGAYGIASSQFTESGVPTRIFGTATGILSVIAFLPDMFVYPMAGKWLDQNPGITGYQYIFYFIIAFSLAAVFCSLAIRIYAQKKVKLAEVGEN